MIAADPDSLHEVLPDPDAVAALVQQLLESPWPMSEADRVELFVRAGLHSSHRRSGKGGIGHGTEQHFALELPLSGAVWGTWVQEADKAVAIYFQFRSGAALPSSEATECFEAIMERFTALYGEPAVPGPGKNAARRMWDANGLELEAHVNPETRSSMMIRVSAC